MRKFFAKLFRGLAKGLEKEQENTVQVEESPEEAQPIILPTQVKKDKKKPSNTTKKTTSKNLIPISIDPRDILEAMEFPFVALSKNRKTPIVYESPDGRTKVKISRHSEHYVASI